MQSLFVIICVMLLALPAQAQDQDQDPRAVLVTGATSGIGKRTVELLSSEGIYVYAGGRKPADLEMLDAMDNVESVRLDVTKPEDIAAAVAQIENGGKGLHGIVNNAGVVIFQPLIEVDEDQLDFLFDVNVYGPYRITKAFAPMLIESKGRVVNISSISGVLSGTFMGPYSMSKHAVEAYNDALALELAAFGVGVSAVEPGNYASKIGASALKRAQEKGIDYENSRYGEQIESGLARGADRDDMAAPIAVARAVQHALISDSPKARYMVTPDQFEAKITIQKLFRELTEMNHDQPYSYGRDELVELLDAALGEL